MCKNKYYTRQVPSMIHSARPTVSPVVNIVFTCYVLLDFEKWGRTDMCENSDPYRLTAGWPSGSITWP